MCAGMFLKESIRFKDGKEHRSMAPSTRIFRYTVGFRMFYWMESEFVFTRQRYRRPTRNGDGCGVVAGPQNHAGKIQAWQFGKSQAIVALCKDFNPERDVENGVESLPAGTRWQEKSPADVPRFATAVGIAD